MISRPMIVAEALSWVGTPHVWQQARKGRGCDCKGLIAGVARELGMREASSIYAGMHQYRNVDCALLREGMDSLFDRADEMLPGDVLILKMNRRPQHLAIVGDGEIIHSYARGPNSVTRTHMGPALRLWPLDSIWKWRGVE